LPAPLNDNRVTVPRISAPKPHDVLASQLRESILRGEIAEGTSLPTERELVAQTGLTRGAVRQALGLLASEGLIRTRPGRYGGNIVTIPGRDSMSDSIMRFVRGRKLPLRTLQETREALEPSFARWAALRRTDADLQELKALHRHLTESVGNLNEFSMTNVRWHNAVAKASGNELLAAVLHSISYGVHVSTSSEEYDTMETRHAVIRIHSRINDAIEAQDADLAERRMREHIAAVHRRAIAAGVLEVPLSAPRRRARGNDPAAGEGASKQTQRKGRDERNAGRRGE